MSSAHDRDALGDGTRADYPLLHPQRPLHTQHLQHPQHPQHPHHPHHPHTHTHTHTHSHHHRPQAVSVVTDSDRVFALSAGSAASTVGTLVDSTPSKKRKTSTSPSLPSHLAITTSSGKPPVGIRTVATSGAAALGSNENPILAALGATPRSSSSPSTFVAAGGFAALNPEPDTEEETDDHQHPVSSGPSRHEPVVAASTPATFPPPSIASLLSLGPGDHSIVHVHSRGVHTVDHPPSTSSISASTMDHGVDPPRGVASKRKREHDRSHDHDHGHNYSVDTDNDEEMKADTVVEEESHRSDPHARPWTTVSTSVHTEPPSFTGAKKQKPTTAAISAGDHSHSADATHAASTAGHLVVAYEHVHSHEAVEEGGFSIDPSDRAVEHRANKAVRREILIASPAPNEDDEWDGTGPAPNGGSLALLGADEAALDEGHTGEHIDLQPVDMILHIFSFLVSAEDFPHMGLVSRRWRELTSRRSLCRSLPSVLPDGAVNWLNFQNLGVKNKGTEGTCFKCHQRSTGKILAMKKARVFPKGEGVPYYMLRELAVLKGVRHDHIASLEMISLAKDELHVFFPYVDKTLHEIINPTGDPSGGRVLPEHVIRRLLHQLLDAIAYCHRRGVLHRNLKPKHLLIKTSDVESLDDSVLQISDFALVRATGIPRRAYTMEVVTLWYRPPEILMGVRGYSPAVDVWSVGCIFAEMAQGKPLFTGISEIDQLFQIFSKLSTPSSESWPGFTSLPNYHFAFPNWKQRPLHRLFPNISELGIDLLSKLLTYNPEQRVSAEDALRHPYFSEAVAPFPAVKPTIPMEQMEYTMARLRASTIPEHVELFHGYLRQTECDSWKEIKYLSRQKTLRPAHRSMLVDWLIEVVDVFEMCLRTAFLAVNYTDRFLDIVMVKKTRFQLLGATCLHVASKCEDVSYIGVEDLAMCADNVYTSAEVLKMEEKLLNTLNFTLSVPTALDFLNIYERMIPPLQKKTSMLAHYLLELALQEYQFLKFLPSVVATCCLSMAMYSVDGFPMSEELADACQYRWADLKECMAELQTLYSNSPSNNLAVIKKRYTKAERCQVATLMPPGTFNMAF